MRDVEKTSMQHETNSRRTRRRKRGLPLYVLMVVILAFTVIITLSMTVLFNIKTIRVTGIAENYRAEDIVEATGISIGDNMMRLNIDEAEKQALETLIHVESVEIHRQFPDTLEIAVQKCTPAYNVVYENGTLIVSEHGRILSNSMDPEEGLVRIVGYDPEETTPGKQIKAAEDRQDRVFSTFRDLIYEGGLGVPVVAVDMSDFNDIMVNFDNRIIFDMGNWSEIDYKISFAERIISEQPADKEGYLIMIGTNQCSFRNKADYEATQKAKKESTYPLGKEELPAETSEDDILPDEEAYPNEEEMPDMTEEISVTETEAFSDYPEEDGRYW